jgi:hypothetical protein
MACPVQNTRNRNAQENDKDKGHDDGHQPMPFGRDRAATPELPAKVFHSKPPCSPSPFFVERHDAADRQLRSS